VTNGVSGPTNGLDKMADVMDLDRLAADMMPKLPPEARGELHLIAVSVREAIRAQESPLLEDMVRDMRTLVLRKCAVWRTTDILLVAASLGAAWNVHHPAKDNVPALLLTAALDVLDETSSMVKH
jgi:hypothetical protein